MRAHRLLIPLAALLAVLPILLHGPSCGHDFTFHLLSWFEAASQFAQLHYPHWAYTPAFNAGEPRFLFYPPISWSLGAVLGLVLPWKDVPAAFTFLALTLSGFTAHRLAARFAAPPAALFAAILYLLNPYMLFTAYERTAYGELLAAAWLPLLFLAALAPRVRILPLALPIALLWLTNAPAAVMGCYALALLTVLRLVQDRRQTPLHDRHPERSSSASSTNSLEEPALSLPKGPPYWSSSTSPALPQATRTFTPSTRLHLALTTLAATLLGLTLSAFYLLPAAYERRYIQSDMALVEGMRIADNTLFHRMPPLTDDTLAHNLVLHTASLVSVILLLTIAATLLFTRHRSAKPYPLPLFPLALLTLLIAFLLTPLSLPLWAHTPELRFLQFPWRLNALLAPILALTSALAFNRLTLKPLTNALASLALAAALILPAWHLFHQPCDPEDTIPARRALFHSNLGTDPTDEYTPQAADNDALAHTDPPFWLAPQTAPNPCDTPPPSASAPSQAPTHLVLDPRIPEILILNRRIYPTWQVLVNGTPTPSCERNDGLIAVPLPPGHDTIDLTYRRPPDQTAGLALSALAALITLSLSRTRIKAG